MRIGVTFSAAAALGIMALGASALAAQKEKAAPASADVLNQGQAVYKQWCVDCHGPLPPPGMGGPGMGFPPAGTLVLEKRYKGKIPSVLTERTNLTDQYIRYMVRNGLGIMPPTRKSEVTDKELDALVAYLTSNKRK